MRCDPRSPGRHRLLRFAKQATQAAPLPPPARIGARLIRCVRAPARCSTGARKLLRAVRDEPAVILAAAVIAESSRDSGLDHVGHHHHRVPPRAPPRSVSVQLAAAQQLQVDLGDLFQHRLHLRGQLDSIAHRVGQLGWNIEQATACRAACAKLHKRRVRGAPPPHIDNPPCHTSAPASAANQTKSSPGCPAIWLTAAGERATEPRCACEDRS